MFEVGGRGRGEGEAGLATKVEQLSESGMVPTDGRQRWKEAGDCQSSGHAPGLRLQAEDICKV